MGWYLERIKKKKYYFPYDFIVKSIMGSVYLHTLNIMVYIITKCLYEFMMSNKAAKQSCGKCKTVIFKWKYHYWQFFWICCLLFALLMRAIFRILHCHLPFNMYSFRKFNLCTWLSWIPRASRSFSVHWYWNKTKLLERTF